MQISYKNHFHLTNNDCISEDDPRNFVRAASRFSLNRVCCKEWIMLTDTSVKIPGNSLIICMYEN